MKKQLHIFLLSALALPVSAQVKTDYTDFERDTMMLDQVEVHASRGRIKNEISPLNTETLGRQEIFRAACCNLGESFTTNPSVDVSYSDAATGAKQIKLLGLSGTYVQMLNENIPAYRGAAIPFALGYVPGTWMLSIQVSKGASSVKNGYEGITGQINIEYLKPQGTEAVHGDLYFDMDRAVVADADGEIHLGDHLSTALLLHYDNLQTEHDANKDGFMDMPRSRQYNLMNRWTWMSPQWISQLVVRGLSEEKQSGMAKDHKHPEGMDLRGLGLYQIRMEARRAEATWKNAFILNHDNNANIALILSGSYHDGDNRFGLRSLDIVQKNAYAQLLYEMDLNEANSLSVGASMNHDWISDKYMEHLKLPLDPQIPLTGANLHERVTETTSGVYAQYTYKVGETFTAMAGLRYDFSNLYDGFWTPRLHLKYTPADWFTLRLAAGKGYRSAHPLIENVTLLASSRLLQMQPRYEQEEAWNMGGTASFTIPLGGNDLSLSADYYYTTFSHQVIIDADRAGVLAIYDLPENGESFSHVTQLEASYPIPGGFDATLAYRYQQVRRSERQADNTIRLCSQPLTSRYKALATIGWHDPLELWQADVTLQVNGGGRLPNGFGRFHSFPQLTAQLTREFRLFSVYVGGENLTNFTQKNPIVGNLQPYGPDFDATMVWGPTDGYMIYAGVRFQLEKY